MPSATLHLRVPFVDVDSSMRIHYTAMFRYMELAEHELMRALDLPYSTALLDRAFPRVHLECDFAGAMRFDDLIDITARVERVGSSSWTVAFTVHPTVTESTHAAPADAKPLATGRMTIVSMDPATERAAPLPPRLRSALLSE